MTDPKFQSGEYFVRIAIPGDLLREYPHIENEKALREFVEWEMKPYAEAMAAMIIDDRKKGHGAWEQRRPE